MQPNIPLAIGAGFASAVALTLAARVPVLAAPILFLIGSPTAFAGLASNASTALAAAATAALLLGFVASPPAALAFLAFVGLPMTLLVHRLLLHRDLPDGTTQWYPTGRVLLNAALLGGLLATGALFLAGGGDEKPLRTSLRQAIDRTLASGLGGDTPLTEEQKGHITEVMFGLLPGSSAIVAMLSLILSLWLAGHLAQAVHRLPRSWPLLSAVQMPAGSALLFACALAGGMLLDGFARLAAWGFAGAFYFAYMLTGLAIVHHVTRGHSWRSFALSTLYASLVIFSGIVSMLLALTGLADGFMKFRKTPQDT